MSFKVDFIGIGSGKCGSTWLYDNLVKHPQICDRNLKELNYFSDLYEQQSPAWYAAQFADCESSQKKGEFSVTYLTHPNAAERIYRDFPDAKLIAIIRDPVKRAFSNYLHSIRKGDIHKELAFSDYIKEEWRLYPGLYVDYLEKYFDLFDRAQMHVIITEEFSKDPLCGYREIYRFIGVDNIDFLPPGHDEHRNQARSYRYLWLENIMVRSYRWLSKRGYTKLVKRVKDSKAVEMIRNVNQDKAPVPQIDEDSRAYLKEYYSPYNQRLEKLLSKDLSAWED